MSAPAMIFSVSTLGRIDPLRRLLSSLRDQLHADDRVVLVAQDREAEVRALAREFDESAPGRLLVTTSPRGASIGRNTGVEHAAAQLDDAILMFPNDTTWYPAGSVATIRKGIGEAPAAAVAVVTPSGPRFELPLPGTRLDRSTVWSVIEMGLVMKLQTFRQVGGFDEAIGTGAASPWQAGEVTDLLLRAIAAQPDLAREFVWIVSANVGGVEEGTGLSPDERAWKLRAYGRGIGHVYRVHRFPLPLRVALIAAGLLVGVRRRREYRLRDGIPAMLGRWEGVRGRPFGDSLRTAVER
ncbi:uncharacterized protein YbaR (Trm112 family) [Microbacterium trichothecenolyticum]|uniref:glycosyltransferase family 2 protein n=1 Tax=Microbacterium trichothecenolyticum TaxID=69370 RepID=UPI002861D166|nr:glycosyltransferase [Microbacterium trichothecenolyticum]MDR7185317.1 uncharacterized protein YbaR (Trm112 family) [Microbacterium trichothecenolyticum]